MTKHLYIFDLDETLINGDCAMIFNTFLVEKDITTQPDFLAQDKQLMALYAQGNLEMQDYLNFSIEPLSTMPTTQVIQLANQYVETHILPIVFPQAITLIQRLKQANIDMLIISASVSYLVTAVARGLDINHSIGIDLVEQDGCFTSQMAGTPSYREGKVTRLKQWLESQSKHYDQLHFYTDSINDLPLCQYADYRYLVNPCANLREYANQDNWQLLEWG